MPGPLEDVYRQMQNNDEQQRLLAIGRAWDAYLRGPETLKKIKQRDGTTIDDNVRVNKARTIVNKGAHFLFGKEVTFELDDQAGAESKATTWLEQCWKANRKSTRLLKAAVQGGIAGHVFVKIVPGAPQTDPYPRLVLLDSSTVFPIWDPDDVEVVLGYSIEYSGTDPQTGKVVNYRQRILGDQLGATSGTWRLLDEHKMPDEIVWTLDADQVWAHAYAPVVDCQNLPLPGSYWGLSDLEDDILKLNRSRGFLLSNWLRIQRFHGHPRTWGRGFNAKELANAPDSTLILPNKDAHLENLEMQSDQAGALALDQQLDDALHEMSQVPPIATGKLDNIGQLSGLAMQILYGPLIDKTETKRLLYGEMLVELNRRLLDLGGFGEQTSTQIHWPELLPSDPMQERQTALLDEQLGVSRDTLQTKLGYDPVLESGKRAKEDAAAAKVGEQALAAVDHGDGVGPDGRANGKAATR